MIRIALVLFFLGLALVGVALRINRRARADDWNAIGILLVGAVFIAVAIVLVLGYGFYKALGS